MTNDVLKVNRMLRRTVLIVTIGAILGGASAPVAAEIAGQVQALSAKVEALRSSYGRIPVAFEENRGQTDERVRFLAGRGEYRVFLTEDEAVLKLGAGEDGGAAAVVRLRLLGASEEVEIRGEMPGEARVSYYLGVDPSEWRTGVQTYGQVRYQAVYPGVDLVFYGDPMRLEYDFIVAPGADPSAIRFLFAGIDGVELDSRGDLVLETPAGALRQLEPVVYQPAAGERTTIEAHYVLSDAGEVSFALADYDPALPLVIDPVLVYSTYLGGMGTDAGLSIDVQADGTAVVTGVTDSPVFPTAGQAASAGQQLVFASSFSADGTQLLYTTILGDAVGDSRGNGVAVDGAGNAYLAVETTACVALVTGCRHGGGCGDAQRRHRFRRGGLDLSGAVSAKAFPYRGRGPATRS